MKLMFTAIKKAGKRALSNWNVCEVKKSTETSGFFISSIVSSKIATLISQF